MQGTSISGTAEISDEGIKKHFKKIEPWYALAELVWNGFDARADTLQVFVEENQCDFVQKVGILDNGEGIDFENIKENFGRFNDSNKVKNAAQHGNHGRGRLAFHVLCRNATWYTKSKAGNAYLGVTSADIKHYSGNQTPEEHSQLKNFPHGTYVELLDFHENLPLQAKLIESFSLEFGWYLALNPSKKILVNSITVPTPTHDFHSEQLNVKNFFFDVSIIRWESKPGSEKSRIYLRNTADVSVHDELSTFNLKPNFFVSIYVKSSWADNFKSGEGDLIDDVSETINSSEWKELTKHVADLTRKIYDDFLRRFVDEKIEKYVENGVFPSYGGVEESYATWRINNTKSIVRAVYTADPSVFNSLNGKQAKIVVRLLDRIAISNENDALYEILEEVLELDKQSTEMLAGQIKQTKLRNIISAIEVIQQRQLAVNKLRELMNVHYAEVLETPDLQQIIESNTWLFGHRYETIGAEEDTFTKTAKNLRDKVLNINFISPFDLEEGSDIGGANRQPDLFLARKTPFRDSLGRKVYRCVIVEIKRPSISLNVTHLRQLDDYAGIIKKYPEFSSELMHFELILLGRKISSSDTEISSRMQSHISKGEMGLVSDDPRMKRYVLNWFTLLDNFELSNSFMLEKLQIQRDSLSHLSKEELVAGLQAEII